MDPFSLRLAGALLGYPLVGALALAGLRVGLRARRRVFGFALAALVLSIPFWLPKDAAVWRFFLALSSVLLFARLWEATEERPASPLSLSTPGRFSLFLFSIGDLQFSTNDAERKQARRAGLFRLGRAGLKLAALALLLVVLSALPTLADSALPRAAWCLLAAYCASTAVSDVLSGATMALSGHREAEVFQSPLIARSPIDFWSQRWNLMFRNAAYRLIFVPAGGRKRAVQASILVFAFSALLHEYLVVAALGHTGGHMAAFFSLQGAATLLNAWARRRTERRMPRPLGIALTWAWMLLTSPLFFVPILEIFPLETLRLW